MKILRFAATAFSIAFVSFCAVICCLVIVFDKYPEIGRAAIEAVKSHRQG